MEPALIESSGTPRLGISDDASAVQAALVERRLETPLVFRLRQEISIHKP